MARRGIMPNMAFTMMLAIAATALTGATDVPTEPPRATIVATARATILSGVRVPSDGRPIASRDRQVPLVLPTPREARCPDAPDHAACRMIVTDLP